MGNGFQAEGINLIFLTVVVVYLGCWCMAAGILFSDIQCGYKRDADKDFWPDLLSSILCGSLGPGSLAIALYYTGGAPHGIWKRPLRNS